MVALPIWPINHKIDNMDEVLVAKLGKSDNKCSDVSLGLQRLHYNSCLIDRLFINVLCSNIFITRLVKLI